MKRHWRTIGAALLAMSAVGCGGKSGSGGGPEKKTPSNGDEQHQQEEGFHLDSEALQALDASYTADLGKGPVWDFRLSVNGEETANLKGAPIADVKNALETQQLKHFDILRAEITVRDGKDEARVLATNVEAVAFSKSDLKEIWDTECASTVNPEVAVEDAGYYSFNDGNRVLIELRVCDFAGYTLKPVIAISPQKKMLEKKTVVYHCALEPDYASTSSKYIHQYTGYVPCGYGYEALPNEQAPKIEILKQYAPGTALYNAKVLRMDSMKLSIGNAGQYLLDTDFELPPFGSLTACHTIKLDVKYATTDGMETARLTFKRSHVQGGTTWMPENSEQWPSMEDIAQYYKVAANEKVHLYRFCEWIPEGQDVEDGNIMVVTGS